MFISILNKYGIVELVTIDEFLKIEAAELAALIEMAAHDSCK
jgi:hypothetical protein